MFAYHTRSPGFGTQRCIIWAWWHMPIPSTKEIEAGGSEVQGLP